MWWIFEGADLVGKTSLAKRFAEDTDHPYFNGFGRRPMNLEDEASWHKCVWTEMKALETLINKNVDNLILDRVVWLSDTAYAPLFKRRIVWDAFERGKAWNVRMVVVYCYCSWEAKCGRGLEQEERYEISLEKDTVLHQNYLDILPLLYPRPIIRINTTNADLEQVYYSFLEMSYHRKWLNENSFWPYDASIEMAPGIRRSK